MDLPTFPDLINNEIPCGEFLAASRRLLKSLDFFGKIFMTIKYDMSKNIDRISRKYNANRKSYTTLQKLVHTEVEKKGNFVAAEALLWLRRCLQMVQLFFEFIVEDYDHDDASEDLVTHLIKAYGLTLEPYDGYMSQQLFALLHRLMPNREQVMRAITDDHDVKSEIVIRRMDRFSRRLRENVYALKKFYEDNQLETIFRL
ncbi:hypothetical protein TKK_0006766 [Trichogramma kaykai]|uniref:Glycolipid transfer protein domain-containing protein n=1 Tax=Trichogramma kaykai TaxID=54128 RepID=A0ABD2XE15_9HYME